MDPDKQKQQGQNSSSVLEAETRRCKAVAFEDGQRTRNQGIQAASRSWKGRKQTLPGAPTRNQTCWHFKVAQLIWGFWPPEWQDNTFELNQQILSVCSSSSRKLRYPCQQHTREITVLLHKKQCDATRISNYCCRQQSGGSPENGKKPDAKKYKCQDSIYIQLKYK